MLQVIQIGPYTHEVRLNGDVLGIVENSRPGIWTVGAFAVSKDEAVQAMIAGADHLRRF